MNTEAIWDYFRARRQSLRAELAARKLSSFLVTKPANILYLSGFRGSAGIAVFSASDATLMVDPRYTLQARSQAVDMEVIEIKDGLLRAAGRRLRKVGRKRVGFEDTHLTWSEFQTVRRESHSSPSWQPAGGLVEELRAVKDAVEIEWIRRAGKLTADVFREVAGSLRTGVSERELAAQIEYRMRLLGAEGAAFETIVASGPRGALPHARPSDKTLRPGEFVIFDLGAVYSGYAADMTRTVYLGTPDRRARSYYESVLDAQCHAVARLQPAVRAGEVDAEARKRLAMRNLDKLFTHSTGHGVGIEIHEQPRVGKGEKTRISAGSIVTVEPGIYIEGWGGIRLEDTVLVAESGPEILTPAPKDRWWIE
jgi:Xaa-Pro aminopeptidase